MKNILNKIDLLNNKKAKLNAVLAVMAFLMMLCLKTALTMRTANWYAPTIIGGCGLTGILMFLVYRKNSSRISKSGIFIVAMEIIIGFSFLLNGLAMSVKSYCFIGAVFMILLPLMHFFFATHDQEKLMQRFCMTLALSYIIMLVVNMFRGPVLVKFQYGAIMGNSNLLGNYLIALIPALVYLLLKKKDTSFKNKAICWGLLVSAVTMLVFTSSRTSVIALFFAIGYLLVTAFISRGKGKKREFKKQHVITVIIITVTVPFIMFFMLSTVRKELIILERKLFTSNSKTAAKDDEDLETDFNLDYYIKGLDGEGEDNFTSGRIIIWKDFTKNLSIMGHESEYREIKEETRTYEHANAHNVYLQVGYSAGIAAGAAYLMAVVFIGVKALILFARSVTKKKKYDLELLLSFSFFIGFAVFSLTADGYMIFNYFPATLFWFTAHNYMYKNKQENEKETIETE